MTVHFGHLILRQRFGIRIHRNDEMLGFISYDGRHRKAGRNTPTAGISNEGYMAAVYVYISVHR